MQIHITIDPAHTEPEVIILTDSMTDEIDRIVRRLTETHPQEIPGFQENLLRMLPQEQILRVYSSSGRVFAVTDGGTYTLRLRLYEAEERLDSGHFVRISQSEVICLRRVRHFDLSLTGTIRVTMENGDVTYVSRRYVAAIKKLLGI